MVRTIRQPPAIVPRAMAACALRITQSGMTSAVVRWRLRMGKLTNAACAPADQRVGRGRRQASPPRDQVPHDRPDQAAQDDGWVDDREVDQALADRLRHRRPEAERGYEVEERRPYDGGRGAQDPRRDDRRDRVRAVVESVDEVEDERDQDDREDEPDRRRHQACLSVMDSSTLATSSDWSRVISRLS